MAVSSPSTSPSGNAKEEENSGKIESRRGRSTEGRGSTGEKGSSQSRSPSRSSKSSSILPSNDTNSTDPESVRCRVFVGNLNTEKIGQEELISHFTQYGAIRGCSLHANFGFVQYASKEEADTAVAKTHGTFLFGKRVDVNIASERRKPQLKDKRKGDEGGMRSRRRSRSRSQERYRSRSPMSRYDELYRKDYPPEWGDRKYPREPFNDKRSDYYDSQEPPIRHRESYDKEPHGQADSKTAGCEVIAMSGDLRSYAESIQSRLHALGINTNIMFPPPDVSVLRIVDSISRSGSLYAVVITSQNSYHKSCTLNVLHGAPQEHRNMPLDDALAFVARNFNQYMNESKDRRPTQWPVPPQPKAHGEAIGKTILTQDPYISGILKMAAGGTPLKVVEVNHLIEALIKYKGEINNSSGSSLSPSAAPSSLEPEQLRHSGRPSRLLEDNLGTHAAASQGFYSSQPSTATFSYGSASSVAQSRSGYPDYEAPSSNAGLGPSTSHSSGVGQQVTGYPASSYSKERSAYPNYYN